MGGRKEGVERCAPLVVRSGPADFYAQVAPPSSVNVASSAPGGPRRRIGWQALPTLDHQKLELQLDFESISQVVVKLATHLQRGAAGGTRTQSHSSLEFD